MHGLITMDFKEAFFFKGFNMLEVAKYTLNDIATYHI
jgi:hypothetical protein